MRVFVQNDTIVAVDDEGRWMHGTGPAFPNPYGPVQPPKPTVGARFWRSDYGLWYTWRNENWEISDASLITKAAAVLRPTSSIDIPAWRAPAGATVLAVRGFRVGGIAATINARRNGVMSHLAADLDLVTEDEWIDGGVVQNTAYAPGDALEVQITSVQGSPDLVVIQVDLV